MVVVIPRQDFDGIISFEEGVDAVRNGFQEYGEHPNTRNQTLTKVYGENGVRLTVHPAACNQEGGVGVMTHSEKVWADNERQGYETIADPVTVLNDPDSGELKAILIGEPGSKRLPSGGVVAFRTACTTAVAIDELAREDANKLGIFGSAKQAQNHLLAINEVRDLDTVWVYSPTEQHRMKYAEELSKIADVSIRAVDTPEKAVESADMISLATNSSTPVFDGELLKRGQTVTSIVTADQQWVEAGFGPELRRETDNETVAQSDLVAVNAIDRIKRANQISITEPIEAGIIDWDDLIPIRDIVAGNHPGRVSEEQTIFYKNNCGEGIADIAIMSRIFSKIEETDVGTEIKVEDPRTDHPLISDIEHSHD